MILPSLPDLNHFRSQDLAEHYTSHQVSKYLRFVCLKLRIELKDFQKKLFSSILNLQKLEKIGQYRTFGVTKQIAKFTSQLLIEMFPG